MVILENYFLKVSITFMKNYTFLLALELTTLRIDGFTSSLITAVTGYLSLCHMKNLSNISVKSDCITVCLYLRNPYMFTYIKIELSSFFAEINNSLFPVVQRVPACAWRNFAPQHFRHILKLKKSAKKLVLQHKIIFGM